MKNKVITYNSSFNGLRGVLYGNSSLSVRKDGREVFHTGFRNIDTYEELVQFIDEEFIQFYSALRQEDEK